MENIIKVDHVSYSYYNKFTALKEVSAEIKEGGKFAVIGANGSGKSTLLQVMGGLRHPSSGEVFYRGEEVTEGSLKDKEFMLTFRQGVGYLFRMQIFIYFALQFLMNYSLVLCN